MGEKSARGANRDVKSGATNSAILSMTGFGRCVEGPFQIEVRSINHRFLDLNIKLPRAHSALEPKVRSLVQEKIKRGRVEVSVSRASTQETNTAISFSEPLFQSALEAVEKAWVHVGASFDQVRNQVALALIGRNDVLSFNSSEEPSSQENELVFTAIAKALESLSLMRRSEGLALGEDIRSRILEIRRMQKELAQRSLLLPNELRRKLSERLSKLAPDVSLDPSRIEQEAAIAAERIDVAEELTRLDTHLTYFLEVLDKDPNGRKLEFITQECLRELNTLGSKIQDAGCQRLVIDSKLEIERIREQLSNVE